MPAGIRIWQRYPQIIRFVLVEARYRGRVYGHSAYTWPNLEHGAHKSRNHIFQKRSVEERLQQHGVRDRSE